LTSFDRLSICTTTKAYSTLFKRKINDSNCFNKNQQTNFFSTTPARNDLMEFFDVKDNWEKETIRHGRPWKMEELRIKSNTDLHKLWYVLHKERNMLLTMEQIYKDKFVPFPSPERISKVDESMENILEVVKERNVAYNLLEHGETKENIPFRRYNSFGLIQYYRTREYLVPWWLNKVWKLKYHYKKLPVCIA
jgi:large subunit ribosomal protein L47